ncbi:MAG: DUF1947 domain-containing protein [Nanobdellota archaeon]
MVKKLRLSKRAIKELNQKIEKFGIEFSKKQAIDYIDDKYYTFDNETIFFSYENKIIPTLKYILKNEIDIPEIIIDMGAIKFIASGADIMAPGVKEKSNFSKGDIVLVKDENNRKPLAVGEALEDSENIRKEGRCVKNIHYVGDDIWKKR